MYDRLRFRSGSNCKNILSSELHSFDFNVLLKGWRANTPKRMGVKISVGLLYFLKERKLLKTGGRLE